MTNGNSGIFSLEELRDFVQQTICHHQQLVPGAFPFYEKLIVRSNRPCGLHFTLNGPRAVHFSAIWDAERNTVLFYDCNGDRFHRAELQHTTAIQIELATLARKDMRQAG